MEAELCKLLTNAWRYIQFATANQFYMIATDHGLDFDRILHGCRHNYPRMAGHARAGLRRRAVPVQGHHAAGRVQPQQLRARPRGDADQRGPADYLVELAKRASTARPDDRRHPRDGVQGRERRPARVAELQAPEAARLLKAAQVLCTDPYVDGPDASCPLERVLAEARRALRRRRRTASTASWQFPGRKPVVDVWNVVTRRDAARSAVMKILVTGSAGFIAGYLVEELLDGRARGRRRRQLLEVRPGRAELPTPPALPPRRRRRQGRRPADGARWPTATTSSPARRSSAGSRYFHEYAYDLMAENERIIAAAFDAAIDASRERHGSQKITVVSSSSMVFENADRLPHARGRRSALPAAAESTYGFQKLACEYFAQGACEQYGLPYTICPAVQLRRRRREAGPAATRRSMRERPAGDEPRRARPGPEGAQGAGPAAHPRRRAPGPPLHLRRRPGPGHPPGDRVTRRRVNEDFNLSTPTVDDRARAGRADLAQDPRRAEPFRYVIRPAASPTTSSGASPRREGQRVLGFEATTTLCRDARRDHPLGPGGDRAWGGSDPRPRDR